MNGTCLIVAGDPVARRTLRTAIEALGLEALEAAGVVQGRKCLRSGLRAVIVVRSSDDTEDLCNVLRTLPMRNVGVETEISYCPRVIIYADDVSVGGVRADADTVARKSDISPSNIEATMRALGVL